LIPRERMLKMKVVIATENAGKFSELKEMLSVYSIEYVPSWSFVCHEPEETGSTYIENAILKAKSIAIQTGLPTIADDSGLEIAALMGYPGIASARCIGPEATGEEKIQYMLNLMEEETNKEAMFVCSLAFIDPLHLTLPSVFTGVVEGTILTSPVGRYDTGLQYDSIFYYPPFDTTFANVGKWRKNRVSHRAHACFQMVHYLDGMMRGYNHGFGNL